MVPVLIILAPPKCRAAVWLTLLVSACRSWPCPTSETLLFVHIYAWFFYHAAFIQIMRDSHPNFRELHSAISRCAGLLQFHPAQFAGKKPYTLSWTTGYCRNKAVCCYKVFKDISVSLNKEIFSQPTTITVMLKLPSGRARFKTEAPDPRLSTRRPNAQQRRCN